MGKEKLRNSAHERAVADGLPYSGALTPLEACQFLNEVADAVIIDVRTKAELNYVGRIPGAVEIEWLGWPDTKVNDNFINELAEAGISKEQPVLFICRTGVRSHNAALATRREGYHEVFNIIEGFEGDPNGNSQRNTVNGWRFHGLPWGQS